MKKVGMYGKLSWKLMVALLLLLFLVIVAYIYFRWFGFNDQQLEELWQQARYTELLESSRNILKDNPFSTEANVFAALALFYSSLGSEVYLEKWPDLFEAVGYIRRALVVAEPSLKPKLHYLLGKSYARLGGSYLNLAATYLELSVREGFVHEDSFESLGFYYAELGDNSRSIAYLEKAVTEENGEAFFLTLAQVLQLNDQLAAAKKYFVQVATASQNDHYRGIALSKLADIYYNEGDLAATKKTLEESLLTKPNPKSLTLLGDVYLREGDTIGARAYWREALRLDAGSVEAQERLRTYS